MNKAISNALIYFCEYHNRIIDVSKFADFIKSNYKENTIIEVRTLLVIQNNIPAITMISNAYDVWEISATPTCQSFKE